MSPLSPSEIRELARALPSWTRRGAVLRRTFVFTDFLQAMKFVNAVARAAEKVKHHPDIDIRWNRVRLALTTHDAGGLTKKDFDLASRANRLAESLQS